MHCFEKCKLDLDMGWDGNERRGANLSDFLQIVLPNFYQANILTLIKSVDWPQVYEGKSIKEVIKDNVG